MKVKSESEVTQSCLTLSDPMDCSLTRLLCPWIFQARVLEWGASAFSAPGGEGLVMNVSVTDTLWAWQDAVSHLSAS